MGKKSNSFQFFQFNSLTNWDLKGATRLLYNYVKKPQKNPNMMFMGMNTTRLKELNY